MNSTAPDSTSKGPGRTARLIIKNTAYLTAAQVVTIPISIGLNAAMARTLGAEAFGTIYFVTTLATFGYLLVNFGHSGAIPMIVAQDKSLAGATLASSLVGRAGLALLVYALLAIGCAVAGYDANTQYALLIVFITHGLISIHAACKDTMRGLERTDLPAAIHVIQQLLTAAVTIPALYFSGNLLVVLTMAVVSHLLFLPPVVRMVRSTGVGRLRFDRATLSRLYLVGAPWVASSVATELQPNLDALYLSQLAPAEVMGWYAVSRRLIGPLLLPATALFGAAYPTLCRLHASDREGFISTSRGMLSNVGLVVVPVAACTGLFPEAGIAIFGREGFAAAEDNMRILSVFLLFLYFSMPIGQTVLASGRQRAWAVVQALCVVNSLILDPLLIPLFQKSHGNGGLGLCVAAVVSEAVVVVGGIVLLPKGVLSWGVLRSLGLSGLCVLPMAVIAWFGRGFSVWLVAPVAVVAYALSAWWTGAVERDHVRALATRVRAKLSRGKGKSS